MRYRRKRPFVGDRLPLKFNLKRGGSPGHRWGCRSGKFAVLPQNRIPLNLLSSCTRLYPKLRPG
jgi:hypothetical protein